MSALQHLGSALMGGSLSDESHFCMMTCYFDESGGEDLKFTFVCGYAATLNQWIAFESDWRILLAQSDITYFHMKEAAHFKKQFSKWEKDTGARDLFMERAAGIINDNVQRGFVALVSHELFDLYDKQFSMKETYKSPYALAARGCVTSANEWRRHSCELALEMEYVFEDGCPDKGGLMASMKTNPRYMSDPIFRPSRDLKPCKKWPDGRRGIVQLQAADFLAYEMRKLLLDHDKIKHGLVPRRKSLAALSLSHIEYLFYDEQRLNAMCGSPKVKRRKP